MVFSSTTFLFLFLPVTLILYYNPIWRGRAFRNILLLLCSLAFYAWGEPVFVFLMIASIFITWLIGFKLSGKNKKIFLTLGIGLHVGIMFIFKYLTFVSSQVGLLLNNSSIHVDIALPIGISFFTFQLMSYLFDVYYGKVEPQRNVLYLGLYISLFPQLIAGPIVRYETIAGEILNRKESFAGIANGMKRFIYGLAKKVLIANYVAQVADNCFDYLSGMSVSLAWLGAIAYTLQIYFDFSGYSDMAIGLGEMFGFHFSENFNYPYIARSITEFWRRWHISLSSWFRDYVYIPLGGNRVSKGKWIRNLFVVWLLTGIWHGANWTFIVWGLAYFGLLLFEKNVKFPSKIGRFSHIYTMVLVILLWVVFRADDIGAAVIYWENMFGIHANGFADAAFIQYMKGTWTVFAAAFIGCTPAVKTLFGYLKKKDINWIEPVWVTGVFIVTIFQIISSTYNPFIYFNF